LHLFAQKPIKKKLYSNFFGVEGCAVDHPRTTIIKEEEEEYYTLSPLFRDALLSVPFFPIICKLLHTMKFALI
jgi:hypothetical protein